MSENVTIKRGTYNKMLVVLVLALMVASFSGGYILGGNGSTTGAVIQQQAPSPSPSPAAPSPVAPSPTARISASVDDDPVQGDANAPVTIIEFSDFECPFCGRFYDQTLPQVLQNYVDTGKAKLVYRDFPLSFHPQATPAAEAAGCANEQGKFWEFHDLIFENQQLLGDSQYKTWASDLGLNTQQFDECVDSRKYQDEVQKDFADGSAAGVSGTPSFLIGNEQDGFVRIVGAQPFTAFQNAIDAELA